MRINKKLIKHREVLSRNIGKNLTIRPKPTPSKMPPPPSGVPTAPLNDLSQQEYIPRPVPSIRILPEMKLVQWQLR
ncbi:MAG: hypothetical protein ACOCV1_03730, partial [Bacillota bacterium]